MADTIKLDSITGDGLRLTYRNLHQVEIGTGFTECKRRIAFDVLDAVEGTGIGVYLVCADDNVKLQLVFDHGQTEAHTLALSFAVINSTEIDVLKYVAGCMQMLTDKQ